MSDATQVADDELPQPPAGGETASEVSIDGSFDAADLAAVPKLGEAIPIGTYHHRVDSYTEHEADPDAKRPDEGRFGKQPQFRISWSVQQEPHTGRRWTDFIDWVSPSVFAAARGGDKAAQQMMARRLVRAKEIMTQAGYKPVGKSDFKGFLDQHPELKIQLGVRERKTYDSNRQLVPTGEMNNFAIKYLPLNRPA